MEDALIKLINMIGMELRRGSLRRVISEQPMGHLIIRLFII